MCMKEPKLVEMFYDMVGIEQELNKETGYVKMCGKCNLEIEGTLGMADLMKEGMMPKRGKKGKKPNPMMDMVRMMVEENDV